MARSAMLYLLAADQGFEVAQSNFAFLLDQGHYVFGSTNESYRRAMSNWLRSGAQGRPAGACVCAKC